MHCSIPHHRLVKGHSPSGLRTSAAVRTPADKHCGCVTGAAMTDLAQLSTSGRSSSYAVNVAIKERPAAALPQPVPIKHSMAYLEQCVRGPGAELQQDAQPEVESAAVPNDNVLEWALRKADQKLNELEHNPMPGQQTVFELSRGPVGQAATQSVEAAAKLTMQATVIAAKAALPVGQWALKEGTKAAMGLVHMALVEGAKKEGTRKLK